MDKILNLIESVSEGFLPTFGTKLYRQIVGIPMGTNCTPIIADLFLFCYERDFMTSLSYNREAELLFKHLTLHLEI